MKAVLVCGGVCVTLVVAGFFGVRAARRPMQDAAKAKWCAGFSAAESDMRLTDTDSLASLLQMDAGKLDVAASEMFGVGMHEAPRADEFARAVRSVAGAAKAGLVGGIIDGERLADEIANSGDLPVC